jgi:hypothetical protein
MKSLLFIAVALFYAGCGQTSEATKAITTMNTDAELAAIHNLRDQFELAIKEGRYGDLQPLAATEIKTVGAGGEGWDEMRRLGQERGMFPYDSLVMSPTETVLLSDSMAYDWGTSKVYYTNEAGEVVELQDSFLVLLKKEGDDWKLFREVASSVVK